MRIATACRVLVAVITFGQGAAGQAYCALRDPVRRIHEAFPGADAHHSIVRSIDETVRSAVAAELPFTVHFNDLGRHTLYVASTNGRPIGLVHVRSEQGDWGMVEIAWSLDPHLRVQGFAFQRCRSRHRGKIDRPEFRNQLAGKSAAELTRLLTDDGTALRPGALAIPAGAEGLAITVVRSALKTLSVTHHAWRPELEKIQLLDRAYAAFPACAGAKVIPTPFSAEVADSLAGLFGASYDSTIDRSTAVLLRVVDDRQRTVGWLMRVDWRSLEDSAVLWWKVDPEPGVVTVTPETGWPSDNVERAFRATAGLTPASIGDCSSAAEMVAAEILLVVRHYGSRATPPR